MVLGDMVKSVPLCTLVAAAKLFVFEELETERCLASCWSEADMALVISLSTRLVVLVGRRLRRHIDQRHGLGAAFTAPKPEILEHAVE